MVQVVDETPGRGEPQVEKLSLMRRAMVRQMDLAATVPCFYLRATADVTGLIDGRARLRAQTGTRPPSVNDAVVRAVALALRAYPAVNASYADGVVERHPRVNVGVAIAVTGGLVVPAVYDADRKSAAAIGAEVRSLSDRAERRKLGRDVLGDATFTVSNLGMHGIEDFDPLLNPPQAAILGVGAVLADGPRHRLRLTLGCDHRVLTGTEGADFLRAVIGHLQDARPLLQVDPEEASHVAR